MSQPSTLAVLNPFLDPVADGLTREAASWIVALKPDPRIQERLDLPAAKSSAGNLTEAERREHEAPIEALGLMGIFKAKARQPLARLAS